MRILVMLVARGKMRDLRGGSASRTETAGKKKKKNIVVIRTSDGCTEPSSRVRVGGEGTEDACWRRRLPGRDAA